MAEDKDRQAREEGQREVHKARAAEAESTATRTDEGEEPRAELDDAVIEAGRAAAEAGEHDRVAMVSRAPTGEPMQHGGWETLLVPDEYREATRRQLVEQAVSNADTAMIAARDEWGAIVNADRDNLDPAARQRRELHESAVERASGRVDDEVPDDEENRSARRQAQPERATRR